MPPVEFSRVKSGRIARYLELQEEKNLRDSDTKKADAEMQRLKALIIADMGRSCTAVCEDGCTVSWKPVCKVGISKNNLDRLKEVHPEIYAEYVTVSESRRFNIKQSKPEAA